MIEKNQPWGAPIRLSGNEPRAHSDAELAQILDTTPGAVVLLDGGDLHFSLGAGPPPDPIALPIDLVEVTVDGARFVAVSHIVARRRLWNGHFAVAMNGTHLGDWNLGPKAHPNDGLVDLTEGRLSLSDRFAARQRAPLGTHVPHPDLRTRRVRDAIWNFSRPLPIRIDGITVANGRRVEILVHPDSGSVVISAPSAQK